MSIIQDQLVPISGKDSNKKTIFMYNQTPDSWGAFSHMISPQSGCIVGVLEIPININQLMVIGGCTDKTLNDSIEMATVSVIHIKLHTASHK